MSIFETKKELPSEVNSPDHAGQDSNRTSQRKPKRSLERLHRSASIDSNGELFFARSASVNSRKLSRGSSFLEESLRDQRENMGLQPLQSGDVSEAAPHAASGATHRRRKLGRSRGKLPPPNMVDEEFVIQIEEGHIPETSGSVMEEGAQTIDDLIEGASIFTLSEDGDNADNSEKDNRLDPTLPLSEPTFIAVQPSDARKQGQEREVVEVEVDKRVFLPNKPQNKNEEVTEIEEKSKRDAKAEMIAPVMPAFPHLRDISVVVTDLLNIAHLRDISVVVTDLLNVDSTLVSLKVQGIQAFLENGQTNVFVSKTFTCLASKKIEQYRYRAQLAFIIAPKHVSIGFFLVKGKHDSNLPWPFSMMVTFKLVNIDDKKSRKRGFRSDINSSKLPECLSQPKSGCNTAIGFADFVSVGTLNNGFIKNNSLIIMARITSKEYVPFSDVKLELPTIIKVKGQQLIF